MKEEYERYLTVEKNINKGRNNEHAVRDLNSGSGDGDILIETRWNTLSPINRLKYP